MPSSGSIVNRKSKIVNDTAFTLIELLTVIAIIGILAAILLPTLAAAKRQAKVKQAQLQISDLVTAIQKYDSDYSRMPVSREAENAALANGGSFTYGTNGVPNATFSLVNPAPVTYNTNNSQVIAILMDITNTTVTSVNMNHQKNPQQTQYLTAKQVSAINLPGVGPDLVYRDPWGNPYIISVDVNEDNQCLDALYRLQSVSQVRPQDSSPPQNYNTQTGYNGLVNTTDDKGNGNHFHYHGNVMVWSAGPDKKIDPTTAPAVGGYNEDNVLSWAQ